MNLDKIILYIAREIQKFIKNFTLIQQAFGVRLNSNLIWKNCDRKTNLQMVFKSKSGYVCGAYPRCLWQKNINSHLNDEAGLSFLFSEAHNYTYPLKSDQKNAIFCRSTYGPTFGKARCDIHIKSNFKNGNESFTSGFFEYELYKN